MRDDLVKPSARAVDVGGMEAAATATGPALTRRAALARERAMPARAPDPVADKPAAGAAPPSTRRDSLAAERARRRTSRPVWISRTGRARRRSARGSHSLGVPLPAGRPVRLGLVLVAVSAGSAAVHQLALSRSLPLPADARDVARHGVLVACLGVLLLVLAGCLESAGHRVAARAVPAGVCLLPPLTALGTALPATLWGATAAAASGARPGALGGAGWWLLAAHPGSAALLVLAAWNGVPHWTAWTRRSIGRAAVGCLVVAVVAVAAGRFVARAVDPPSGDTLVVRAAVVGMLITAALVATAPPRRPRAAARGGRRARRRAAERLGRRTVRHGALPWLRPLTPAAPTVALALAPTLAGDARALISGQLWSAALVPVSSVAAAGGAVLATRAVTLVREAKADSARHARHQSREALAWIDARPQPASPAPELAVLVRPRAPGRIVMQTRRETLGRDRSRPAPSWTVEELAALRPAGPESRPPGGTREPRGVRPDA